MELVPALEKMDKILIYIYFNREVSQVEIVKNLNISRATAFRKTKIWRIEEVLLSWWWKI